LGGGGGHPTPARRHEDLGRPQTHRSTSRQNIAKVAAARKLLTLVYYGLRDGHIRALTRQRAAA